MANDLAELHERINYNNIEIAEFTTKLRDYVNSAVKKRIVQKPSGLYDVMYLVSEPVPLALRSKAGTIVNDLRSILDALACALAKREKKNCKHVYFPIAESKAIFEDVGIKKISKLSPTNQGIIAGLAPYKEGDAMLHYLHQVDINRKHQTLAAGAPSGGKFNIGNGAFVGDVSTSRMHFDNCAFNDIEVKWLSVNPNGSIFSEIGREYPAFTGVPAGLSVEMEISICYTQLEDYYGWDVPVSLNIFRDKVREVVSKFD